MVDGIARWLEGIGPYARALLFWRRPKKRSPGDLRRLSAPDKEWETAFNNLHINRWIGAIEAASRNENEFRFCSGRIHRQAIKAAIAGASDKAAQGSDKLHHFDADNDP